MFTNALNINIFPKIRKNTLIKFRDKFSGNGKYEAISEGNILELNGAWTKSILCEFLNTVTNL
jgi:hypothetical protein